MLLAVAAVAAAYLIGSLSFAVIVSRAMGLADPRTFGSGNPGATNVLRSGSRVAAVLVLLLDAFKGWLPVVLVKVWGPDFGLGPWVLALIGLAAFLGHLYPIFFRFQGGKGVATAAGVLLGFEPWLGLAAIASFVMIAAFFRYASLASVVAGSFAPIYYLLGGGIAWALRVPVLLALIAMGLLVIWRHRGNIGRLLGGQEPRIGEKKRDS